MHENKSLLQQLWHVGIIVFLSIYLSLSLFHDLHAITVVGMNFFLFFILFFNGHFFSLPWRQNSKTAALLKCHVCH